MLTGRITPQALDAELSKYPDYDANYQPNMDHVASLSNVLTATHFVVIIGTWCPDCHRDIPRFMRVLSSANNTILTAQYIGVNRDKEDPENESQAYDFTRLPTYIAIQNGKEVGRITERPETTLEQDLVKILS